MASIPTWVYLLFIGLLYLGIKRGFASTVKVRRLLVIPILFLWLSLHSALKLFPINDLNVLSYIVGVIIGGGLGFLQLKSIQITADKQQGLLRIPGDWSFIILIMTIFIVEFSINYLAAIGSPVLHMPAFAITALLISGLIVGNTIGRNGCYLYKFINASHTRLEFVNRF